MRNRCAVIALAMMGVGCASNAKPVVAQEPATADSSVRNIPVGLGTLKQDEFTVGLRSDALLIKVTPLEEAIIRLAAPDTYNRLHALRESRAADAQGSNYGAPEMFLVSFFSYQPDVPFQPEDLQLEHQGQVMRPTSILPLTPVARISTDLMARSGRKSLEKS